MSEPRSIELHTDGSTGIIRLNRPRRANAYDQEMLEAIHDALAKFHSSGRCRVLLVEAAGDRAFCGGADLARMEEASPESALDLRSQAVFDAIARSPMVSIAAVHGPAVAGGFELALACDLRVAAPEATFSLPETALGLIPSAGGTTRLTRLVGPARAKSVILGGRILDAETALGWGLLDRVVADPRSEARAWARQVASRDPVAQRLAKEIIDQHSSTASLAAERVSEAFLYSRKKH